MHGPADLSKAKNCALRLIKFRLRSEKEIRDKLKEKEISPEAIEETIGFLKKTGLLDDVLFAKLWAESRVKRQLGLSRLRYELNKKGIDKGIIEDALENVSANYNEADAIKEIVELKLKKMRHLDRARAKSRLYGYLLRRGYPHDKVYDALHVAFKADTEDE
ncbi:MAG: regulatory protein RecX [Candidatus Omnitrophica bacterium]|nr:regulatory protein RecX [Candidatus Omnitrophota bacterium]